MRIAFGCASLAVLGLSAQLQAQSVGFNEDQGRSGLFDRRAGLAIADRPQPGFDPVPVQVGGFDVLPSVSGTVGYDDNIFADNAQKEDDAVFTASGLVDARSNWSRNALRLLARGTLVRYAGHGGQDAELYAIGTSGRLDVVDGTSLQAGVQYSRDEVPRTSSRAPVAVTQPILYNELFAFVGGTYGGQQLRLITEANVRAQRYDHVETLDPGVVGLDFADRNIFTGLVRGEYAVSQSWFVFAEARGNLRRFPDGDNERRSNGYELLAGVNFELAALVRGEIGLGYIRQHFATDVFTDYSGVAYHAKVQYFPTQLVTLTFTADREVDDAGLVGFGAFIENSYALQAEYEYARNIVITPQIGFGRDQYQGQDLRFHRFFAGLDGRWTLSPHLVASAAYLHQQRDGNNPVLTRDFDENTVTLGLTYRF